MGYLAGYEEALVSGELPQDATNAAAKARWAEDWRKRLAAARGRRAESR